MAVPAEFARVLHDPVSILLFGSSALFAWSMGSHYSGAVMGTAYGSGVLSLRRALLLGAIFALLGSVFASPNVVDTYAHGLVAGGTAVDIAAALVASALVTTLSTYYRLPTSTIQIYTFSLLGVALMQHLAIRAAGFGLVIFFWVAGPLAAFAIANVLGRTPLAAARTGTRYLTWFVVVASLYSSVTLGSNDVSNAVSAFVMLKLLSPHLAGLWGGAFMAIGVVTWGKRLTERIGKGIVRMDVPLAATAQFSQALTLSVVNALGYNASINQTIVGGLAGAGSVAKRAHLDRKVVRNIAAGWVLSPLLGIGSAALTSIVLRAVFAQGAH